MRAAALLTALVLAACGSGDATPKGDAMPRSDAARAPGPQPGGSSDLATIQRRGIAAPAGDRSETRAQAGRPSEDATTNAPAAAGTPSEPPPRAQVPTFATPSPAERGPERKPLVALVPSDDPAITDALAAGLRLAFAEARAASGPALELSVSTRTAAWGSAVEGAVRDAVDTDAVALVAPPERRNAHLLVQLGTKVRLPVVSTSAARSVVGAGSSWVVAAVPTSPGVGDGPPAPPAFDATSGAAATFVAAFRAAAGRDPAPWDAAGYDAGRAIVEAVRRNGLHRAGLLGALVHGDPVRGASGAFAFDGSGARRSAASKAGAASSSPASSPPGILREPEAPRAATERATGVPR